MAHCAACRCTRPTLKQCNCPNGCSESSARWQIDIEKKHAPPAWSSLQAAAGSACDEGPAAEEEDGPADSDEPADRSESTAADDEAAIPRARGGTGCPVCGPGAAAAGDWLGEAADGDA